MQTDRNRGVRSPAQDKKLASLEKSIVALANAKGAIRFDGKPSSIGTVRTTINVSKESAKRLHRLGFELEDIQNLGERHIRALVEDWEKNGLAEKTMQNGDPVRGSVRTQLASLLMGYSYRYSDKTAFSISVGAGLTRDTPDLTLNLKIPMSF